MGVDARLVIKYRGEKPTEKQLAIWSFDLVTVVGAKHFWIQDGLPSAEYVKASAAWHAAFDAHKNYEGWNKSADELPWSVKQDIRRTIIADIGDPPEERRHAIRFTSSLSYYIDPRDPFLVEDADGNEIPGVAGKVYTQDGPAVFAEDGEWLLDISVMTRYYGEDYERGDILTLCAIAEWVEVNIPNCSVWYGGDSSGCELELFDNQRRSALRRHLYSPNGRDYFQRSIERNVQTIPAPCGLCIPGEPRFSQYGYGNTFAAVSCSGCGKNFESRDNGATWTVATDKD